MEEDMAQVQGMKHIPPVNRLRNGLPKVGIRPTIDGRREGIRESLEQQTMEMAQGAARLITENLTHPCGLPVECVIAESTIGGVAEATRCEEQFQREGVGLSLTVTPCWCYGSETMDMDPLRPKAVWGFNGTERPGAVYLAAVLAAHTQKGLPAFGIYGRDVQDPGDTTVPPDVKEKILRFVTAGLAVARMKGTSYLSFGSVSMGIAGSIVDETFFQDFLGMRNEYVDMSEFIRRLDQNIFDPEEFELAAAWVKDNCQEGPDNNRQDLKKTAGEKEQDWAVSIKMTMIARDLMVGNPRLAELGFPEEALGHNALASGFQGQRQWTDFMPSADFMETMLNTSFDWNGIRQPFIMATENDCMNGVAMLFGHLLTGTSQIFSDVRTYWSNDAIKRVTGKSLSGIGKNGIIHLINSGSTTMDGTGQQSRDGKPVMKQYWDITREEAAACLDATRFCAANREYFRGGGFSTTFLTLGNMPVTMSRVNLVKGLGPVLQIAEGHTVDLDKDIHTTLDKRTDPTWPTTWFAPRLTGTGAFSDVYSVMANWGANHGAITYGHIGADLITLASMLRIPVSMHNVPAKSIFRPSAWASFGMEPEGSDYRACALFGPRYS